MAETQSHPVTNSLWTSIRACSSSFRTSRTRAVRRSPISDVTRSSTSPRATARSSSRTIRMASSCIAAKRSPRSRRAIRRCRCLFGSFSKTFLPGLRVGWVIADREVIRRMAPAKQTMDSSTGTLGQRIVLEFERRGGVPAHVAKLRDMYRTKQERGRVALAREFAGTGVTWNDPDGGFYFWVRLPGRDQLEHAADGRARGGRRVRPRLRLRHLARPLRSVSLLDQRPDPRSHRRRRPPAAPRL